MKYLRFMAFILALILLISVFSACDDEDEDIDENQGMWVG